MIKVVVEKSCVTEITLSWDTLPVFFSWGALAAHTKIVFASRPLLQQPE
jgi:hypothetical protein